ncbi:MAG: hypothetical protein R3Y07_06290, partial [Eubacteriales bacterium]
MLSVLLLPGDLTERNNRLIAALVEGLSASPHKIYTKIQDCPKSSPLLVCLSLGEDGQNFAYYRLLSYLRRNPTALEGLKVGMV